MFIGTMGIDASIFHRKIKIITVMKPKKTTRDNWLMVNGYGLKNS